MIKHADNFDLANEELTLYREGIADSQMAYRIWSEIHGRLDTALTRIAEEGARRATRSSVQPGTIPYLWADAIANGLYELHHARSPRWSSTRYLRGQNFSSSIQFPPPNKGTRLIW